MKIIVVCNSKTGFTKRYVDWIAEELNCDVHSYKDFSKTVMETDDIIIFCSRVHAGKIEYLNKIKPYFYNQSKKIFIVVATGATPAAAEDVINKIWANNFTETEIKSIPHFYMQSGLDYEKMGFADRTIMKIVSKFMSGKKDKTDNEAGFEQAIQNSYDISSREYIMPLIRFIKDNFNNG